MSQFKANKNYERHVQNMDYTQIQNAKAKAIDEENWSELSRVQELENSTIN
jgi:hypothetical protein